MHLLFAFAIRPLRLLVIGDSRNVHCKRVKFWFWRYRPTTANFPNMFQIADSASTTVGYVSATSKFINLGVGAAVPEVSRLIHLFRKHYPQHTATPMSVPVPTSKPVLRGAVQSEANYGNNCAWKKITIYTDISALCAVAPATGLCE